MPVWKQEKKREGSRKMRERSLTYPIQFPPFVQTWFDSDKSFGTCVASRKLSMEGIDEMKTWKGLNLSRCCAFRTQERQRTNPHTYLWKHCITFVKEDFQNSCREFQVIFSLCLIPDSKLSLLISAQMFTNTTVIIGYAIKCHPCRNKVTNTHARKPCPFWLAFWVTWGGQGEKCSLQFSSIKHKNPNYCIYSKKGFPRAVETWVTICLQSAWAVVLVDRLDESQSASQE